MPSQNKFDTFSSGWYRDVAPLIVIIIVLSAILPICGRQCNHCCCRRCKQRCCRNKKVMQQDLDKLYAGKEWRIAGWYGHLNFVAAACIALSAGIPALLPLGGLLFLYTYWSMKCLCKSPGNHPFGIPPLPCPPYTKPPRYHRKAQHQTSLSFLQTAGTLTHVFLWSFLCCCNVYR